MDFRGRPERGAESGFRVLEYGRRRERPSVKKGRRMIVRMRGRFSVKQGGTAGIFPVPATVGLLRDRIFVFSGGTGMYILEKSWRPGA